MRLAAAAAALATLGACSGGGEDPPVAPGATSTFRTFRQSLGLTAPPPDEFLIVSRAPLEAPPDFRTLPPPDLGAASRVERDPRRSAQAALAGAGAPAGAAPGAAASEAGLLAAAGAGAADPAIRETLAAEARPTQRRFGLDSVFGIPIVQDPSVEAERLDPRAEAERLRAQGANPPVAPPEPAP